MQQLILTFFILLFLGRERALVSASGGVRGCGIKADAGIDPTTLKSWPEPKSSVQHLTAGATQAPPSMLTSLTICLSILIFPAAHGDVTMVCPQETEALHLPMGFSPVAHCRFPMWPPVSETGPQCPVFCPWLHPCAILLLTVLSLLNFPVDFYLFALF